MIGKMEGAELTLTFVEGAQETVEIGAGPGGLAAWAEGALVKIDEKDLSCRIDKDIVGVEVGVEDGLLVEAGDRLADGVPEGIAEGGLGGELGKGPRVGNAPGDEIAAIEEEGPLAAGGHGERHREALLVERVEQMEFAPHAGPLEAEVGVGIADQAARKASPAVPFQDQSNGFMDKKAGGSTPGRAVFPAGLEGSGLEEVERGLLKQGLLVDKDRVGIAVEAAGHGAERLARGKGWLGERHPPLWMKKRVENSSQTGQEGLIGPFAKFWVWQIPVLRSGGPGQTWREMAAGSTRRTSWADSVVGLFWRLAASGWVPAGWFLKALPAEEQRAGRTGPLRLEIVSHCWQYAPFLMYQLSSLINFPPREVTVTMTVYYSPDDARTAALLGWVGDKSVPGITWQWRPRPATSLFRRAIGRNEAALQTNADWVWFTDCDLLFRDNCLDALGRALQGRRDALVYPRVERVSALLQEESPILSVDPLQPRIIDIPPESFHESSRGRATGPLQIAHGDVARACGYCRDIPYYQKPTASWAKAHEDRAFRWLLRTEGTPVDVPGVYRIRHQAKGRYRPGSPLSRLRAWIRRRQQSLST